MVGPSTTDAGKVAALREALPAVNAGIYLDAPRSGPLPAESAAAMADVLDWEVRTGRVHRDRAADVEARLDEARAAAAAILTADLDDVALTHGRDDALARAIRTIDWSPGKRLGVVGDPELAGVAPLVPPGVALEHVEPAGDALPLGLGLVVLPLVRATTGERLPVERIAAAARAQGAATLVEVSLALGAVPVDRTALGADVLVGRSDAWLLGPEGLGLLVRPGAGAGAKSGPGASPVAPPGALHLPSVVGFARAAGWLSMYVGLPWVHARGAALTQAAADRLAGIPGVELLTPAARATTLAFRIGGWPAERALDELGGRIFLLASARAAEDALRIGIGFWNTSEEIDRLAGAVALLAAHTPETLPPRPRLTVLGADR